MLKKLDENAATSAVKDPEGQMQYRDVETDHFQNKIDNALQPVEVDAKDRSVGAFFKRARNVALSGVSTDIHKAVQENEEILTMHGEQGAFFCISGSGGCC